MKIIYGGRSRGKMLAAEEFMKLLPEAYRKDIIVVKASDPVPELKGNKLPRMRLLPIEFYEDETKD